MSTYLPDSKTPDNISGRRLTHRHMASRSSQVDAKATSGDKSSCSYDASNRSSVLSRRQLGSQNVTTCTMCGMDSVQRPKKLYIDKLIEDDLIQVDKALKEEIAKRIAPKR